MPDEPTPRAASGWSAGLILLVLITAGLVWWFTRGESTEPTPEVNFTQIDVVCLGRVDGLKPVISLDPTAPGRVASIQPEIEGKHLNPGDEILRLDDTALQLRVKEAQAAVDAAQIAIDTAKAEEKLFPLRKETQQAAVAAAGDRIATARRLLEEKKTAREFGTVTAAEIIAAEAEIRQLERLETTERTRLKELEATDPGLAVRAAEAKKIAAEIALEQAQLAVKECVLKAPTSGTVLRVFVSVGEAVAPGTPRPAVSFRPDGPIVVRAELEQEFLGRVKAGMTATITDDARADSPTWNGRVVSIGNVVGRKRSILLEPGVINDVRTVECVITIDSNTADLLIGQRMRVRIGGE